MMRPRSGTSGGFLNAGFLELLQTSRHRLVRLLTALLAPAPLALVLADARAPALRSKRDRDEIITYIRA